MRKLSLAAALALFTMGMTGTASAQVKNCNNGNAAVGTVVGAIVGGTTGGLIIDNRRSFRSSGFRGRGFSRGRRGNQGLGIALGAIAGGIVGNQIATANNRNCFRQQRSFKNQQLAHQNQQGLAGGPIDYNARRLGDPYGGRTLTTGNQQTTNAPQSSVPQQGNSAGVFQPVCQDVNRQTQLPDGQIINESVEFCQFSPGGEWIQR